MARNELVTFENLRASQTFFHTKMLLLTYTVSLLRIIVAVADSVAVKGECRQIEFGDALSNSRLSDDHVIRVYHVQNEPNCKVKCFLEPDCVAYNYGKNSEGNLQCELCNKSQVPSNHVMVTPGFIFRPVAENPCITNPCPHSFTCQVGFRDQGYRCASHGM
ncbi:uncharacterized protein LOC141884609 [Acropora palmata]|uniref:uncharacterized protein LOC141884609 n=1 Tax=Acropora palmata TaxID=6131 RepID=UPI003DA130CF